MNESDDILPRLRDLLPGVPDVRIRSIVDVCERHFASQAGRRSRKQGTAGSEGTGASTQLSMGEMSNNGRISQHSSSDLNPSDQTPGPSQSDPKISKLDGPTGLVFTVVGREGSPREWPLGKAFVAKLAAAFPGVDVMCECRKALLWTEAKPRNRKTFDGMGEFLLRWMSKAQNLGGRSPMPAAPAAPPADLCTFHLTARTMGQPARQFVETCSECRHVRARNNPRSASEPTPIGGTK